jgi:predicted peptidase
MPQADSGTKDSDFHRKDYEDAVMELTYKVCSEKNGDVKRLSVAGHSNGACAVGHIVENYPGVFAAAAPISGTTKGSEGMNQTNLWSFRGSYDSATVDRTAKNIISKGGNKAQYTVFAKKGHAIQAYVFEQELTDKYTGQKTTLLDWLMSKTTA